ncbi:MAG: protein kinase domain-containing protein [Gemmatimonadales bacterium]
MSHEPTELRARLQAILEGRYAIERELGRGGMAHVFLARDLHHGRMVAIKLFLPEIAAAFGRGRFLREIRTAANLSHPHILALYDSGEGDDLLYYVMPYVEGESLAQRLTREGQLPIDEALDVTRQVAAALQHAHTHGIVHRDIKPGNILLSAGHAFVADFGIAYALEESGGERLTSAGFALGTPAYMSPEQSIGAGKLDGRADIYSLGCVLYEMLAGDPPFSGRSAQAVLARHSVERVPSVRAVRDTVPPALEHAIRRALAKSPADRFLTADEFVAALTPDRLSRKMRIEPEPGSRRARTLWMAAGGVVTLVLLAVLAARGPWGGRGVESTALNPDLVAVLPFQTGGVADSALGAAAVELADLMAQRFPGEGGPRAVFPATTRAALTRITGEAAPVVSEATALAVGRALGAGLVIQGEISRSGDRMVLSAVLERAPRGDVLARVQGLSAHRDSLLPLLDELAAHLLVGAAGEPADRRPLLVKTPLPALRSYLNGRRLFVNGRFEQAARAYREALSAKPDFGLAALGLASSGRFVNDSVRDVGVGPALAMRDALPARDRELLNALAGPRWPADPSLPERMEGWNRAALEAPDRMEVFYHFGETLFHDGPWTGTPDPLRRAGNAFRRAVQMEPRFAPALGHLIDLAASDGDTASVRAMGLRYLAVDSTSELADYYRWRVAVALGDEVGRRRVIDRADSLSGETLERMINVTQLDGVALEDGLRAAKSRWSQGALDASNRWGFVKQRELALNRGRPAEADSLARAWRASQPLRARDRLSLIVDALLWQADTLLAAELVRENEAKVDGTLPAEAGPIHYDVCAVGLWRMSRGSADRVPAAIAALRRVPDPLADPQTGFIAVCADILDAQLAAALDRPDALAKLERLDSLARTSPPTITWILATANLTAARLWERRGDPSRALAATRRRLLITDFGEPRVLVAYSTFLEEESRLAARAGDPAGAVRAARRYLALRDNVEPVRAADVARIRAALDSLESRGSRSQ